ncbi:hypothetical protein L1987_46029 [Smallanthus sonchifolius]|uniref:Uncharacterized protein n=1 Tax=Smallanthus sonchifolius TaxID=185202 RepID=A0ACB9FZL4_9ASTR|nr:hypothetical protein L1987_46029 [Smallanthus sonchifolius]
MSNESNTNSSFSLKSILEKDKLDKSNFMDWYRNLIIVIKAENKLYVLEEPILEEPAAATGQARKTWDKHVDDSIKVSCLMLASMIPELQKNLVDMPAYDMIRQLQEINELAGDIILNSLPKSYDQFTLNYNINAWDKTISELHIMLKTAEINIPAPAKSGPVLMINEGQFKKSEAKEKGKKSFKSKGKGKAVAKKLVKDVKCFHCDEGLKKVRRMKQGDLELHVGNGQKVAVKAVGEHTLLLPSSLELGLFYFSTKPDNGTYEIEVHDNNVLFNIFSKRTKYDVNDTYLWNCRLGHINKNRMKKLQTTRILNSTGQESFDDCESCLIGKLTKAPFTCIDQRAKDLLGLVHTDVYGPFRTMSRNGER